MKKIQVYIQEGKTIHKQSRRHNEAGNDMSRYGAAGVTRDDTDSVVEPRKLNSPRRK